MSMHIDILNSIDLALVEYEHANGTYQDDFELHQELDRQLNQTKADLAEAIANEVDDKGKPLYSNEDKRKAELARRLQTEKAGLLESHADAEKGKRQSFAALERAVERLKTLRAMLRYQSTLMEFEMSNRELQAAKRMDAASKATPARQPYRDVTSHTRLTPARVHEEIEELFS